MRLDGSSVTPLGAARYSRLPFPAYRFIPGEQPHPTADPRGHSFRTPGSPVPHVDWVPPERWSESAEYLFGVDLYNHGYWWEAHEAWESLWQLADKSRSQGQFLQGLIQCGACHLKWHVGQLDGVARLRRSSRAYLDFVMANAAGPLFMGLDVPAFVTAMDDYYDRILHDRPPRLGHEPARYPYIRLHAK